MDTPEKEIKTLFAWSELSEKESAMFAFAVQQDDEGFVLHSAVCGNGLLIFEGLKAMIEDNTDMLEVVKAVADFYDRDKTTSIPIN